MRSGDPCPCCLGKTAPHEKGANCNNCYLVFDSEGGWCSHRALHQLDRGAAKPEPRPRQ